MDVPMDYHVWNTMLGHYQWHMTKLVNVMPRLKTILLIMQNDLLHEFTDKTSGSAMAEGPREALVSKNPATTKHLTWKPYCVALFAWFYV